MNLPPPPPPRTQPAPGLGLPAQFNPYFDLTNLPFPVNCYKLIGFASGQLMTGAGLLISANVLATSITAEAVMYLFDGTGTGNDRLANFTVGGSLAQNFAWGLPGVPFKRGLFASQNAGGMIGCFTYIPLQPPFPWDQ